jgi:hypothetical protein
MQVVRKIAMPTIVNMTGNTCAAVVFITRASNDRDAIALVATHRHHPKALCADSESRILAMKKFSCSTASRLIAARQNRFFARIASG